MQKAYKFHPFFNFRLLIGNTQDSTPIFLQEILIPPFWATCWATPSDVSVFHGSEKKLSLKIKNLLIKNGNSALWTPKWLANILKHLKNYAIYIFFWFVKNFFKNLSGCFPRLHRIGDHHVGLDGEDGIK